MAKQKTGRIYVTKSLSVHPEDLIRYEARAKALGFRSFNEYANACIKKDANAGGVDFVMPVMRNQPPEEPSKPTRRRSS